MEELGAVRRRGIMPRLASMLRQRLVLARVLASASRIARSAGDNTPRRRVAHNRQDCLERRQKGGHGSLLRRKVFSMGDERGERKEWPRGKKTKNLTRFFCFLFLTSEHR